MQVYLPDKNIVGEIVQEMAYGAVVKYIWGGIQFEELMDRDDYDILDDMFFEREEK
jgi:hypothetical protein